MVLHHHTLRMLPLGSQIPGSRDPRVGGPDGPSDHLTLEVLKDPPRGGEVLVRCSRGRTKGIHLRSIHRAV